MQRGDSATWRCPIRVPFRTCYEGSAGHSNLAKKSISIEATAFLPSRVHTRECFLSSAISAGATAGRDRLELCPLQGEIRFSAKREHPRARRIAQADSCTEVASIGPHGFPNLHIYVARPGKPPSAAQS